MPALLTMPCRPPSASAAATARAHSASWVTSWRTNTAALPSSAASRRPSSSRTSPMTALPPSATSMRASAAPCPRAPPLIRTTLSLNRVTLVLPAYPLHVNAMNPGERIARAGLAQSTRRSNHCRGTIARSNPMKIKRIEHIAIAVKDIDAMREVLEKKLGIEFEYEEYLPQHATRLAMFPVGQTYLELLESNKPDTGTSRWIAEHGEGLFHICLEVDDIDAAMAELRVKGVGFQQEK